MINRRNFIKKSALISGASTLCMATPLSLSASNSKVNNTTKINWNKTICKFCSIGCGIIVGTQKVKDDIKIVSIKADDKSPINNGLLCQKGYLNDKIPLFNQRIKTPMLKMKNNKYDKNGTFTKITWEEAFNIMEEKAKYALMSSGVDGVGVFTSGATSIDEGYVISKMFKAGFRSNNIFNTSQFNNDISSNARNTIFGTDVQSGTFDDIELSDTIVSWGVNFAETYPILLKRIQKTQAKKSFDFNFINITTIKNDTSKSADLELFIKPSTDLLILNYIAREFIYNNEEKIDWYFLRNHTIFTALGDINKNTTADRYEQWEISFNEYKSSLEKYTLEYISSRVKANDDESLEKFQIKLIKLKDLYIQKNNKILSYWSKAINTQDNGFQTNLALYSLHLLLNKHSKNGSGAFALNGQASANGTSFEVGTLSNKLPANMFIKYKEHRSKAEAIWNIPDGTLNPIATNNPYQLLDNIANGTTKFVWINSSNPYHSLPNNLKYINDIKENKDLFIVTSDCYASISAVLGDLILPTATQFEKHTILGNTSRYTQLSKQLILPYGESMSDIWQWIEFSKRFTPKDLWGYKLASNNQILKNIKKDLKKYPYNETTSMYKILFANKKAKSYILKKDSSRLNTEVFSDKRDIKDSEGFIFAGYGFFIQKYLFEEYRMFGLGVGHDLASFDNYQDGLAIRWPYIYNKSIKYIFNPIDDVYARKIAKIRDTFKFYGKMGRKKLPFGDMYNITNPKEKSLKYRAKIFSIPYVKQYTIKEDKYDILLTSIKLLEQFNTGTITMRIDKLYKQTQQSYGYINENTAKNKNLKNDDLCFIESNLGKIKIRIKIDSRFEVANNTIAVALFDEKVLINKITNSINKTYIKITKIKENV